MGGWFFKANGNSPLFTINCDNATYAQNNWENQSQLNIGPNAITWTTI